MKNTSSLHNVMEFLNLVEILRDTLTIFRKNGRLMANVALITVFVHTSLKMPDFYATKTVISDRFFEKMLSPINASSTDLGTMSKDLGSFLCIEFLDYLVDSIAFLLSATTTILASATIFISKNDLSFSDLLLKTVKSLKGPFVTWLYQTLFTIIFIFLFFQILMCLGLLISSPSAYAASTVSLCILASVIYLFIMSVWFLSIVTSVLEETSGAEAIPKAWRIIEGMKLKACLLNLLFIALCQVLHTGVRLVFPAKDSESWNAIIGGWVVIHSVGLIDIFWAASYTILFCHCKKARGEVVELQGSNDSENEKSTTPLLGKHMP